MTRFRPALIILSAVFFLFLLNSQGVAGSISLETESNASVKGTELELAIKITNKGNESAHSVMPQLLIPANSAYLTSTPELPPGKTVEIRHRLDLNAGLPGSYSMSLLTHYTDAGRYPFSAVSPIFYNQGESRPALIVPKLTDRTLSGKSLLKLAVKSLSDKPLPIHCRLYVPREILCPSPERKETLAPGGISFLTFPVQNIGALNGSRYAVFALIDYEQDNYHYSDMASAFLILSGLRAAPPSPWLIGSVGSLLLAAIFYGLLAWLRRKPARG
jgi:hypothetical protein